MTESNTHPCPVEGGDSSGESIGKRLIRWAAAGENGLLALSLLGLMLVPLVEAILRKGFDAGISGAAPIVQNLVFISGMLGAAVAAREGRLLSLGSVSEFLKGRWKDGVQVFTGAVSGAVSFFLAAGSWRYAMSTREGGETVFYDIPLWWIQAVMPVCFGLISLRIFLKAGNHWLVKTLSFLLAAGVVAFCLKTEIYPEDLVWPFLGILILATALGAPIFTALGGAALILFFGEELPIASLAIDHYQMAVNPTLPTIPLFTLAGYFLAEGGASKRLIHVFQSWVGHLRGGPAILTALVCAFFTSFTGASGVTILALGGLLMPVLIAANYSERFSLGLLTGSGSLGLLFPPCIPLILYAVVATSAGGRVSIEEMFLGGILPGTLMVLLTSAWGVWQSKPVASEEPLRFNFQEARKAFWAAKWELLLPVVALTSLFGGFATAVEAASVTALYALFVEAVVYRDLRSFRKILKVMSDCGLLVGGVLVILGVAMGFNNYLIDVQAPDRALEWVETNIESPWMFLLALNVFLLAVGMVMDIFSALIVIVPLIIPMGLAFNIHPVHLGIVFLANLQLGYLTPPVGMNLFLASYRFEKPLTQVYIAALPMFAVLLVAVLLVTFIPALTTWLPGLLGGP